MITNTQTKFYNSFKNHIQVEKLNHIQFDF